MNLQHLIYFRELAQDPHMPTVAEKLGISQSTLSYSLNKLEDELGVPLFEKQGRNIQLTLYGKIFYKYICDGLKSIETGKNKVIDLSLGQNGKLALGSSYIVDNDFIADVISGFRHDHPQDKINFVIKRGTTPNLLADLNQDRVQLAMMTVMFNSYKSKEYDFDPIFRRHFVAAVPKNHPLSKRKSVSLKDLVIYPIITFSELSGIRPRLDNLWKRNELQPHYQAEADDVRTILSLVECGEGIALIPKSQYHMLPNLKYLHLIEDSHYTIYLVNKKMASLPKKTLMFKNYIEQYCQKHKLNENNA